MKPILKRKENQNANKLAYGQYSGDKRDRFYHAMAVDTAT
jgi:hypothetical protein